LEAPHAPGLGIEPGQDVLGKVVVSIPKAGGEDAKGIREGNRAFPRFPWARNSRRFAL